MKEITIKNLQECILKIDNTPNAIDKYFQKLVEEVGELSKEAIRLKAAVKHCFYRCEGGI